VSILFHVWKRKNTVKGICTIVKPIKKITDEFCKNLRLFFTDIDGTITDHGQIPEISYGAMWELAKNGIKVIPVTGRPAGWCDHIARMWPVKGVIGENGAFYYWYDRINRKMERTYLIAEDERQRGQAVLDRIKRRVLDEVPRCAIAADQPFRIADLAIDYNEDVSYLSKEEVNKICAIITEEGATYKVSNIHVNCWYGNYNKIDGVKQFVKKMYAEDFDQIRNTITYIGDSPNDESLFHDFSITIGVANIKNFVTAQYPVENNKKNIKS